MSSMRREDRIHRQQRDDGDPTDTVYLKQTATATSGTKAVYHDTLECHQAPGDRSEYTTVERERAHDQWLSPCRMCVLDAVDHSPGTRPCPFCGREYSRLPAHLPCPDQGGDSA